MIDVAEVVVPRADLATPTAPQPSTDVQFQPLKEDIQGFYTIMPGGVSTFRKMVIAATARRHTSFWLRLQPLLSSRIVSPTLFGTSPLKCWQQISLEQRGANGASRDGRVRTAMQSSPLSLDCPSMPTHAVFPTGYSFDQN